MFIRCDFLKQAPKLKKFYFVRSLRFPFVQKRAAFTHRLAFTFTVQRAIFAPTEINSDCGWHRMKYVTGWEWGWCFIARGGDMTERFQLKLMYVELIGCPRFTLRTFRFCFVLSPPSCPDEIYLFLTFNPIYFTVFWIQTFFSPSLHKIRSAFEGKLN